MRANATPPKTEPKGSSGGKPSDSYRLIRRNIVVPTAKMANPALPLAGYKSKSPFQKKKKPIKENILTQSYYTCQEAYHLVCKSSHNK